MQKDNRDPHAIGLALMATKKDAPELSASQRYDRYLPRMIIQHYGESEHEYNRRVLKYHSSTFTFVEVQDGRFVGQARKTS